MPAHRSHCHVHGPPNTFHGIREWNVIFVLDTSGSMYESLPAVKDHLIQELNCRAQALPHFKFNIIEFNSKVRKWCDRSVWCSPNSLAEAVSWILCLECQSVSDGLSTVTALNEALLDPDCHAVCLVTDGIPYCPNREPTCRPCQPHKVPIHVVCVSGNDRKSPPQNFLLEVTQETGGTFRMLSLETVVPSSVLTTQDEFLCHSGLWSLQSPITKPPIKASVTGDSLDGSQGAPRLMRGVRILARKHDDGLFYAAHISQEEQSSKDVFLVQFEKGKRIGEKHNSLLQKTRLCDIVQIDEAARHPIIPGDAVLAPLNLNMKKYGPGIVLLGQERREYRSDAETSEHLVVNFWNGRTANVSAGVAIWIPRQMYDFLVLELQMPPSAREKFLESHPNYPFTVPPGYRPWRDDGDLAKDLFDRSLTHVVSPSCPHHSHGQTCDLLGTNIEREMEGSANKGSSLYGLGEKKQSSRLQWQSGSAQNQTRNRKAADKGGKEEQKPKEKKLQKPMQSSLNIEESSMACSERNAVEHQERKTSTQHDQGRPQAAAMFFKMPEIPYSCLASRRLAFEGINELLRKDQKAIETVIQKPTIQKRKI